MYKRFLIIVCLIFTLSVINAGNIYADNDPLPSWNNTAAKERIISFVKEVTKTGGNNYVAEENRIAVFDNDGTLCTEKPLYLPYVFVMDRVLAIAGEHPEWKHKEPFKSVLEKTGKQRYDEVLDGFTDLFIATSTGMTTDEYSRIVENWLDTARHPRFNEIYTDLIYQPMLELLQYLQKNGFRNFIVSGGETDFVRPWIKRTFNIPPEQVIGSYINMRYEIRDDKPVLIRTKDIEFLTNEKNKPVAINRFIGKRPIAAFGNSDGDQAMLNWVTAEKGLRLGVLIHHTDSEREYAYDLENTSSRLDKALIDSITKNWLIVDMKKDWKTVFPIK